MANHSSPVRVPAPVRLALMLAVAALVTGACGGESATPPESPTGAAAPTTEAAPPASPDPRPSTTDPAPDPETDAGTDDPEATTGQEPDGESTDDAPADEDDPGAPPAPAGLSPEMEARLAALLDELAGLAEEWDPTGRASLAIVSADGTLHGFNERRRHISASAVKPLWTAAAIDLAGLAAVAPLAPAALVQSDNFAAGGIIDLIGIDTVNTWTADVAGTTGTHLAAWYFGTDRVAQSVIDGGTRANLTTVGDLALFYARLQRGELLDAEGFAALEEWLRATDRGALASGAVTGAILARLPEEVAGAAIHKAGWLPPYCCRAEVRLVIDAGVIPLPDGSWFAIAAVSDRGEFYNLSVRWVSLAACRAYALLADDPDHDCDRSGDGVPRPDLWGPPPEPEATDPEADPADPEADPADPETGPTDPESEGPDRTGPESESPEPESPDPAQHPDDTTGTENTEPPDAETPPGTTEPEPQDTEGAAEPEESPPATGGSGN